MENTKKVAEKMKIVPKLRLGNKKQGGGVESTGPHIVKFISDSLVMGKDPITQKPRQEMQYIVEESGVIYRWNTPINDKQGNPHYLIERLMAIKEGEEVVLEMKRSGVNNYIDVRRVSEPSDEVEVGEVEEFGEEQE